MATLFILFVSYHIGSVFISVYGAAADAILQCYCLDLELHKEKQEPAKFVPATLKTFLENNNMV